MSIKIHAQSIFTPRMPGFDTDGEDGYKRINAGVARVYDKVLRPDTVVDVEFVPRSSYYTSHSYLELLNNSEIVRGIIEGVEQGGADVAFVRCGNDPAIREARESVSVPVVGMTEATMHLACQLGARFAVIGVEEKCIPLVERNLRNYGLENRAISRRPVRIPPGDEFQEIVRQGARWFDEFEFVRASVLPHFEKSAQECIDDGAEIIVTGCALLGSLTLGDYNKVTGTEVPVLDSLSVGIKTAEMLGELHRSIGLATSKQLTYKSLLTPEMRDALASPFFR
ncbi:aspartate/glutamate racemase family protein [Nocardia sp. NPDC058499]|uniref:aspartate/glutamate racemase family protein n=1 Tax=Nocardia sp. NPDC058499 TaxID=3346530 RepID=UPI00365FFD17